MDTKGYYKILGVEEKATQEEIKKAYRKKAMECHPDHFPDDKEKEEQFQCLNEANEILSDPAKRSDYDKGAHPKDPFQNFRGGRSPFEDFEDFFNRRTGRTINPEDALNLRCKVVVTLEDFFGSKEVPVTYERSKPISEKQTCPACGGKGRSEENFFGTIQIAICGNCGGTGSFMFVKRQTDTINIQLKYGQVIYRVPGMGDVDSEGRFGAVEFHLAFSPSNGFHVEPGNMNLVYKMKLSLKEFLAGAEIVVQRFGTTFRLKHVNSGEAVRSYRVKGKGLALQTAITDLIIEVTPKLPVTVNTEETELLTKLCEMRNFSEQSRTP